MNERQQRIQQLLLLLADRSRFRMLCALVDGPVHVSELAIRVGLSQSCATRHVQALGAAGAVSARRDGKRVMVALRDDEEIVRTLTAWVAGHGGDVAAELPQRPAREAGPGANVRAREPVVTGKAKEVAPAAAPDSGTPPRANEDLGPMPPARARALEDFLL